MKRILIVGSGASGVHFALSVLKKGHDVIMVDVGQSKSTVPNPEANFGELKSSLNDPVDYYLGQNLEAVVYPGSDRKYYTKPYAFPPSKNHVFAKPNGFTFEATGFEPMFSFAQGGLAEAWTGGVYPLNDAELAEFPFRYRDIEPGYGEVAGRIGIIGVDDDLARFFPLHANLIEPLRLDEHSAQLVANYEKRKPFLHRTLKSYLGRSRVATLTSDRDGRKACSYRGRCLWGCPDGALYTPSITLAECQRYPNFSYLPDLLVSHFEFDAAGRITRLVAESLVDRKMHEFTADEFILAAGTLSSSKIYMDSIWKATGRIVKLTGLMDNRQILLPFVNVKRIGSKYNPKNYQYHQLAMGIESDKPEEYLHGQITTLKTALLHPIIHNIPLDLRTATLLFRNARASLGVVNLNLHDRRRDTNYVTLEPDPASGRSKLVIHYVPEPGEETRIKEGIRKVKRVLWNLGCVVPPGMTHVRPMGSSVHYAGTIPMSASPQSHTANAFCQSHKFENLYFVDGTTFPFLPAKNLTFTLMANAVRIADCVF